MNPTSSDKRAPDCRNVYAVLVHERPDCVVDLVRNLRHLDPHSPILLYNGGTDPDLLRRFPFARYGAVVHPAPTPQKWGRLEGFALDCMAFAGAHLPFDLLTIVDSDQLAVQPDYPRFMAPYLRPGLGMFGSTDQPQRPGDPRAVPPAQTAHEEIDLWRPYLRTFPDGEAQYVHWTFWPATTFTAAGAEALVDRFRHDRQLAELMAVTRIWASEEILFPTLLRLMGLGVAKNPCDQTYVRFRTPYDGGQVRDALKRRRAFWLHPAPRIYNHEVRLQIREAFGDYPLRPVQAVASGRRRTPDHLPTPSASFAAVADVDGWLSAAEAELLCIAAARAAAVDTPGRDIVEVGGFCGRASLLLGEALQCAPQGGRLTVVASERARNCRGPVSGCLVGDTFAQLQHHLRTRLSGVTVHCLEADAPLPPSEAPLSLLFLDGRHDYHAVAADYHHYARRLAVGGLLVLHDVAAYCPDVVAFCEELLASEVYRRVARAESLVVLQKLCGEAPCPEPLVAPPAILQAPVTSQDTASVVSGGRDTGPLVSCIMPTRDRPGFAARAAACFLAQDYPDKELVVIDNGCAVRRDLPDDPRIRYLHVDDHLPLGSLRNLACEQARGSVIVHWDDDDWSAAGRLSRQVAHLRQSGADVCGLHRVLFLAPDQHKAWRYVYPAAGRPWVHGGTLCYTRTFWARNPFPPIQVGEDLGFLWSSQPKRVLPHDGEHLYVALIHGGNTSPKLTADKRFQPVDPSEVRALLPEVFLTTDPSPVAHATVDV